MCLRIPNSLWKDPSICISFAWDTCKRHATFENQFTNKATHNTYMRQIWTTWSMYIIHIGLQGGEKGIHLQEWIHCCPRLISRVQEWCYFLALSTSCCGLSLVLTFFCIYAPIFVASTLHPQKFVALLKLPTIIKKKSWFKKKKPSII